MIRATRRAWPHMTHVDRVAFIVFLPLFVLGYFGLWVLCNFLPEIPTER